MTAFFLGRGSFMSALSCRARSVALPWSSPHEQLEVGLRERRLGPESSAFRPSSADSSGGLVYLHCLQDQIDGTYRDFGYVVCTGVGYRVGGTPKCQLSATGINFGTVAVGSHVDRTLTVTNTGGGVLTGSVAPSGCPELTDVGDPTVALGPGQSATYTIRLTPSQSGHAYTCYAFVGHPYCSMVTYSGQWQ